MRRGGRASWSVAVTPAIEKLSVWELDGNTAGKACRIFTAAPTILPAGYAFCPALYREVFFAKLIDNHGVIMSEKLQVVTLLGSLRKGHLMAWLHVPCRKLLRRAWK